MTESRAQSPARPLLSAAEIALSADAIIHTQLPSGQIPWFAGGETDPWDHVESAMALDVAGRHEPARRAYDWLRRNQNPDGSWYRGYLGSRVVDATRESNFTAYLAVGLWHHYHTTGDLAFLTTMWPALQRALGFVLALQHPDGKIGWALDPDGVPAAEALLTGCASMYHSLCCALAIADALGEPQPDWDLAATSLGHVIAAHPDRFSPRERHAMDWYYPVLTGVLRGPAARTHLDLAWDRFVVPGLGVRCVSDRPWVTGAETAELVLALCRVGDHARASELIASVRHLRHADGSYWTGYVYPDEAYWPVERTTWTAAAIILASAVLADEPATCAAFGAGSAPQSLLVSCDQRGCPA